MRTTLRIDDDVLEAARDLAERRKSSVGAIISELARRALSTLTPSPRSSRSAPYHFRSEQGVPVFDIPADAQPIGTEMVRRAYDDEP